MNFKIRKPILFGISLVMSALFLTQPALAADLIRRGDRGDNVKEVQTRLAELGLMNKSTRTGYFGPQTEDAVMAFQRYVDIKSDGIVGNDTSSRLFKTYAVTTVVPGSKGKKVEDLQARLAELGYYEGAIDGVCGRQTTAAVKTFQKYNSLTADGIAGKATLSKLESDKAVSEKQGRRAGVSDKKASTKTSSRSDSNRPTADAVLDYADNYLGRPYIYGANGPSSFDCSGFTTYVFKKFGINLPRTAQQQGYNDIGTKITSSSKLKKGDLVFFNTVSDSDLSDHVGIYIGDGDFIHASSGSARKVTISNLNTNSYYSARFSWGRRIIG